MGDIADNKDGIKAYLVDDDSGNQSEITNNNSLKIEIVGTSGNSADVDASGNLKTTGSGGGSGNVKIEGNTSGNIAEVDSSNRVLVSTVAITPPTATAVSRTAYSNMSGTQDTLYTITNGKTLTISSFVGGAEASPNGSVIELYEDPNGNLSVLNIIAVIFCLGSSNQIDLNEQYIGNGTRRILLRRRNLSGGSQEHFGRWSGFEITT